MQAYNCLTDVLVRDLLNTTVHRFNNPTVLNSPAYKYLLSMEDKTCHLEVRGSSRVGIRIGARMYTERLLCGSMLTAVNRCPPTGPQVIEYCDLGNLSNALKNNIFMIPNPVIAAAAGAGDGAAAAELAERARQQPMKVGAPARCGRASGARMSKQPMPFGAWISPACGGLREAYRAPYAARSRPTCLASVASSPAGQHAHPAAHADRDRVGLRLPAPNGGGALRHQVSRPHVLRWGS